MKKNEKKNAAVSTILSFVTFDCGKFLICKHNNEVFILCHTVKSKQKHKFSSYNSSNMTSSVLFWANICTFDVVREKTNMDF